MSNVIIRGNMEQELQRLNTTGFFRDKPADQPQSSYLYDVALREARRWGTNDPLALHYAQMSAYARTVGA